MRVAICSVGAELLSGEIADTNAAWMAARVQETGGRVGKVIVVGDDRREIADGLEWLAARAETILVGGGLGPTSDDLTRDAVADFAGVPLRRRDELVTHLTEIYARLGRPMPPDALRQADIPDGASAHEPVGSAAGFAVDAERAGRTVRVHVLPGVPWEYQAMAERDVLPDLVRRGDGTARVTRTLHVAGEGESWIGDQLCGLTDRLERDPDVELGYLAKTDEVQVRVTAAAPSPTAARARATAILDEAAGLLGATVTSVDGKRLEDVVVGLLRMRGLSVATAESFTSGRLAAALSAPPDGPDVLRGGLVLPHLGFAQSDVTAAHLPDADVRKTEAAQVRERFGADIGIAVTGDPDGTVGWAIAGPGDARHQEQTHIVGDRAIVLARGVAFTLEALRRHLAAS